MDWQPWFISADGTLTPMAIGITVALIALIVLHEFTRPQLPRVFTRTGCFISLLMVPLLALFLSIVVIRVVHILET